MDDIKAAHTTLTERGVTFAAEPHMIAKLPDREVWMAFIEDGEGNTLGLMNEVPITAG